MNFLGIRLCRYSSVTSESFDRLFSGRPEFSAGPDAEKKLRCGAAFDAPEAQDGEYRVYSAQSGEFLMLGRAESGVMKPVKSFFEI